MTYKRLRKVLTDGCYKVIEKTPMLSETEISEIVKGFEYHPLGYYYKTDCKYIYEVCSI